jgi:methanogenesis marker radical SAM protein
MEIFTDVGGRTGVDCGGFCEFCFYKNVDFNNLEPIACINCPPNQIGCDYCQNIIKRVSNNFKSFSRVLTELKEKLNNEEYKTLNHKDFKIIIAGGADVFNYPHLYELVSRLKESQLHLHLGYTSGKPIKHENMAQSLISLGVDEVSFSVFSTNPDIRKKWMKDETPEGSIKGLKMFCENIDLNASAVIIPGVNDGDKIFETCVDLEEWGVKSFFLRRFANFKNQGLILNNKPLIEGINPQSYEEFQELVHEVTREFSFKVSGYPFYDPQNESPFAISKIKNKNYLERLQDIKSEVTIITSKLAEPYLHKIFSVIDKFNLVNIVSVDKDIADLITHEDLESINLDEVKRNVIIPSGALVHDKKAAEILCSDGKFRIITRGPYVLTNPYYDGDLYKEDLLNFELKSFNALIDVINSF